MTLADERLRELDNPSLGQRSPMRDYPPPVRAEVLLQCGTLTGWLGSAQIHIRRTIVEVWAGRYYEAMGILQESKAVSVASSSVRSGCVSSASLAASSLSVEEAGLRPFQYSSRCK
jgi:hypothetical protein